MLVSSYHTVEGFWSTEGSDLDSPLEHWAVEVGHSEDSCRLECKHTSHEDKALLAGQSWGFVHNSAWFLASEPQGETRL